MATTVTTHVAVQSAVEVHRVVTVDGVETARTVVATVYEPEVADLLVLALGTQTVED